MYTDNMDLGSHRSSLIRKGWVLRGIQVTFNYYLIIIIFPLVCSSHTCCRIGELSLIQTQYCI